MAPHARLASRGSAQLLIGETDRGEIIERGGVGESYISYQANFTPLIIGILEIFRTKLSLIDSTQGQGIKGKGKEARCNIGAAGVCPGARG